jgi:hypothetical protein
VHGAPVPTDCRTKFSRRDQQTNSEKIVSRRPQTTASDLGLSVPCSLAEIPCYARENSLFRCTICSQLRGQKHWFPALMPLQTGPDRSNSLLFSLLAGNLPWRIVRAGLPAQPATRTSLSPRPRGWIFIRHFRQLGRPEVNSSGPFHPQFAACGVLRAFSLPLTFWHLPNAMLKHQASRRWLPESRGDANSE